VAKSDEARRDMANKVAWHKNARFRIEGTTLHIEVELDEDKVDASEENGFLSSVESNLPSPPIRVNVWVRPLRQDAWRER